MIPLKGTMFLDLQQNPLYWILNIYLTKKKSYILVLYIFLHEGYVVLQCNFSISVPFRINPPKNMQWNQKLTTLNTFPFWYSELEQGRENDHGIAIFIRHIDFNFGFFWSSLQGCFPSWVGNCDKSTHNPMN